MLLCSARHKNPIGLRWRASSWTITFFVTFSITVDQLVHAILIPVLPFQLQKLGHSNVSVLTGWLCFCHSAGFVTSTIPIALLSERYPSRRWPFLFAVFILMGAQIMLMEAPKFPIMCVAQLTQGVGTCLVSVIGLAILSDSAPPTLIGSQLDVALSGLSVGLMIGPPIGGTLYFRYGFRGPFVCSLVAAFLDLIARLIIIERKDAIKFGYDPAAIQSKPETRDFEIGPQTTAKNVVLASTHNASGLENGRKENDASTYPSVSGDQPSLLTLVAKLVKSPRALTALFITFVYGAVFSAQEPVIPLHLQLVWGLNARSVGISWIAAVIPTLFSSFFAGFWVDKSGTEWPTAICLLLSLPWWITMIFEYRLALFIAAFALKSFFMSGITSPMTVELARTSRNLNGVGFGHVYGAYNLVYGIGSTIGPILGGQMYAHIEKGWMALCLLFIGLFVLCLCLCFRFVGDKPLYARLTICGLKGISTTHM